LYKFTEHDNIAHYDWRLRAVTTAAAPFVSPNGVLFEAGTPIVAICPVEYNPKMQLRYNFPSVSALLLDYSHKLWSEGSNTLELFTEGHGTASSPKLPKSDGPLLDLLERRMAAVVFAYTAIEAFSNEALTFAYTHKKWVYSRINPGDGDALYTLDDIQRFMSLDDKLCGPLPEFFGVKSLKKNDALWQTFKHMTRIRHFIAHPKLEVQKSPKERTLWKLLVDTTFRDFAELVSICGGIPGAA